MTDYKFPKGFSDYACEGDYIEVTVGDYVIRATLEYDSVVKPTDYECYDEEQIEAWHKDEWFFGGVVMSASCNGVRLNLCTSVWGLEVNLPGCTNEHITEAANQMLDEALNEATRVRMELIKKLTGYGHA